MEKKVSLWLRIVTIGVFILYVLSKIESLFDGFDLIGIAIAGIVFFFCARQCSIWAGKLNKNVNLGYAIGFFLSLFGLLGYFIYYNLTKKREV